jgi:hypothetical protein
VARVSKTRRLSRFLGLGLMFILMVDDSVSKVFRQDPGLLLPHEADTVSQLQCICSGEKCSLLRGENLRAVKSTSDLQERVVVLG